jgi:hypothetical protein
VQDQPNPPTVSMGHRPDSWCVSQTRYRTTINHLENSSCSLDGGMGCRVENAPHVAVALRRPVDEFSVRSCWARPAPALGRKQQTVLLFPQQAVEMQ